MNRVSTDPRVCHGQACISGTRITRLACLNTATAVLMLPIGLSLVHLLAEQLDASHQLRVRK